MRIANQKIILVGLVVFSFFLFSAPSALAVNEVCPAGMTAATTCCVPPPALAAGCPVGKVWIGSASGGGCRTPASCPAAQFSCATNACVATSSGTAVCPGQLHIGNNVCVDTLTVIRQALTDTVYKVWRGTVLGRLVTVPDSDCVDGQTPVWNNTTKAWACGQGDSLWLASGNDMSNTNTGNVGIGTVSGPITKLTVTASGAKTDHFFGATIGNTTTSSTAAKLKLGLGVSSTGTWDGAGSINYGLSVNATGGTVNYAAIFNGGYVGIGTNTPGSGLHIKKDGWPGSFLILDTNATNQDAGIRLNENAVTKWHLYNQGANGDTLSIENATGPLLTLGQVGRVGVNNTNPRSALDIGNSGNFSLTATTDLPGGIIFQNSTGGTKAAIVTNPTVGEGGLRFIGRGGNIDMMTANNGNVGIGTASPQANLQVNTTVDRSIILLTDSVSGSTATDGLRIADINGNASIVNFENGDLQLATNAITGLTVTSTQKVGIATPIPKSTLDVEGNAAIGATYSGTTAAPTNGLIVEGNVGIGTSAPAEKLEVNGNIKVASSYFKTDQGGSIELRGNAAASTPYIDFSKGWGGLDYDTRLYVEPTWGDFHIAGRGVYVDTGLRVSNGLWVTGGLSVSNVATISKSLHVGEAIMASNGLPSCTGALVGYSFENDGCYDTGMFSNSDGVINLCRNGNCSWTLASSGIFAMNTNQYSDRRIKENIQPYPIGLDTLMKINPVIYDYNGLGGSEKGTKGIGVIAQDLQKVLPEAIHTNKTKLQPDDAEETDLLAVDSSILPIVAINAIKEQQGMIETQGKIIVDLQHEILELKALISSTR